VPEQLLLFTAASLYVMFVRARNRSSPVELFVAESASHVPSM
jgi:hypothetical protein